MKRYIYIIIGIVAVAVIAILVLLFIKNRSANPTITSTNTTGSLPAVGTQGGANNISSQGETQNNPSTVISLGTTVSASTTNQTTIQSFGILSNSPVLDYFVDPKNNIIAIQPNGTVISISNGQTTVLNSSTMVDIISASFSFDGKKALVNFGDPTNPQTTLFDEKTNTWTALPEGMQSPQWSPSANYQISYLSAVGTGKLSLSMINAANLKSGVATLLTLNANDMTLQWPTKTQFIISDKPTFYTSGSAWLFNSLNSALAPIIYENNGLESIWSHTTNTIGLVFSAGSSGRNRSLQLENPAGTSLQQLNLSTLPSKCLFDPEMTASTTETTSSAYLALYCGIPRTSSGFSSARLPDDYNMMALFTSDDIYKINTATGDTQILWNDQAQNMDVSDMRTFNNTLFFVNRYDQKLYGLIFQ